MATEIDSLQIEMNAKATKANDAIDRLVKKLDILSTSLGKINGSSLNGLSNGVQRLGNAMQSMNNIRTTDFTRLANNLERLGNINVSSLNSSASSISHLTRAFNGLGTVSSNAQQIGVLVNSLSRLGGASVQRAITNLPQLATAMNNLLTTLSKAPRVSQNVIDMTNALSNLASQGSRVGSASSSISNGLNRASTSATRAKKSFGGLASAIGKFYATYFLAIRGIKGLWKSVESSMDYIETLNYFNKSFEQVAEKADLGSWEQLGYDSAEAYYNSFAERAEELTTKLSGYTVSDTGMLLSTNMPSLGINPSQVMQYQSMFGQMASSMGVTSEIALQLSDALTMIGSDLASVRNMDFDKVWTDMASGLAGMSRTLDKYGVNIRNVNLQQKLNELGIQANIQSLNQNEKALLRTIILLDSTRYAWGDLAETINQPANQLRLLKANFENLARTIGNIFLPIVAKVLPYINGLVIALQRLAQFIVNLLGFEGFDWGGVSGSSVDVNELLGLEDATDNLATANKEAEKLKKTTLGIDELNINAPEESGADSGVGSFSGIDVGLQDALSDIMGEYQSKWDEAFAEMENRANEFADKIEKAFEPVKKLFKDIAIGDWFAVGQDVSNITSGIFDFFSRAIQKVDWNELGKKFGEFLKGIEWTKVFNSIGNFFETLINAAIDLWKGSFNADPIATLIITALGASKFLGLDTVLKNKLTKEVANALPSSLNIGKTILLAGITWEIGFEVGKELGKQIFGEEFQEYYENFHFFGEGGFFNEVSDDWRTTVQSSLQMATDLGSGPVTEFLKFLDNAAVETDLYSNKMLEFGLYMLQMGTTWQDSWMNSTEKAGKALETGIANMGQKADSGLSELGNMIRKKTDKITGDWQVSMDFLETAMNVTIGILNNDGETGMNNLVSVVNNGLDLINAGFSEKTNSINTIVNNGLNLIKNSWEEKTSEVNTIWHTGMDSIISGTELGMDNTNSMLALKTEAMQLIWDGNNKALSNSLDNTITSSLGTLEKGLATMNKDVEKGTVSMIAKLSAQLAASGLKFGIETQNMKSKMQETTESMETMWTNTTDLINKSVESSTRTMLSKTTSGMNGVIFGFENILDDVVKNVNKLIRSINESLGGFIQSIPMIGFIPKFRRVSLPQYATGGFPEDGLFMANHTELVGQFTNGKTAVANNEMIVAGIEEAAYRGFTRAYSENNREANLLEELIVAVREGKDIQIDGRSLVQAYDERKARNGYVFG